MIRQQIKDLYFAINRWLTLPNHYLASVRYRNRHNDGYYLQLGSGVDYRDGLINIEGNFLRKKDLWLDLRNGLPFPDRSVCLLFCSHTLEHLYPDEALRLLREIRRTLTSDGVARIAVPSLEYALRIAAGEATAPWPRAFEDSYAQSINYLFCDGQHKYGYSFAVLKSFAHEAGFRRINNYSAAFGEAPKRYGKVEVGNEPPGSLIVELAR